VALLAHVLEGRIARQEREMEAKFAEQFRQILEALMKAAPLKFVTDRDYILLTIWFVHCQTLPRGKKLNARGNYAHFVNAVLKTLAAECPEMLVLGGLLAKKNVRQLWTQKVGRKIREGWSKWLNSIAAGRAPAKYTDRERAVKAIFNALSPELYLKGEIALAAEHLGIPDQERDDARQETFVKLLEASATNARIFYVNYKGKLMLNKGKSGDPGTGKIRDLLRSPGKKMKPVAPVSLDTPLGKHEPPSAASLDVAAISMYESARRRGPNHQAALHRHLAKVSLKEAQALFPESTVKLIRKADAWAIEEMKRHLA
jgi:hypothetical protein